MKRIKSFIEGLKEGRDLFGSIISGIINSILLTLVYIIGVGITSIFARIVGKKFLKMSLEKNKKTYWTELNLNVNKMEEYYKQF